MAGGSQIVINGQGVTVTTNGKVIFKAGQHIFEGGEQIPIPKFSLPTSETLYSNKIDYISSSEQGSSCLNNDVFCFVVDKLTGALITSNNIGNSKMMTSERFYTREKQEVISFLMFGDRLSATQESEINERGFVDPLLDEALLSLFNGDENV